MTTHHKDDCPCGSGKRYKHCHFPADEARKRRGWTAGIALLGVVVLGGAGWGMYGQWQAGRAPVPAATTTPGGAGGDVSGTNAPVPGGTFGGIVPGLNQPSPLAQGAAPAVTPGQGTNEVLPGENPKPWEYQVAKDRHYDPRPGHMHWHEGPPPADTSAAAGAAIPQPIVTTTGGTAAQTTTSISPTFRADLAPGENPKPWEFDAKNNRHFNPQPGHGHWHPGPAPPASAR